MDACGYPAPFSSVENVHAGCWKKRLYLPGRRRVVLVDVLSLRGAGAREFLIQNWTREHGIPGTTVTSIAQTPDGYLWLGTFAGLARFDGVRFVTWDLRQKAGVPDNSVSTLSVDGQGNLWIGTSGGHLVRLSAGRFTAYLPPSRQTADRYVQRVIDDKAGTIWALNYEGGLSVLNGDSFGALTNTTELLALVRSANGNVWAASPNQLFNSKEGQLQSVWTAEQESGFQINALAAARRQDRVETGSVLGID